MTPTWTQLIDAAYRVNADEFELEDRHRGRFGLVMTEPDGSVVVAIERHPSLTGRRTVGEPSPGFFRVRYTFRIDVASPAFILLSEGNAGLDVDVDALASEELELLWDAVGDEILASVSTCRNRAAIEEVCARTVATWDVELSWMSEDLVDLEHAMVADAVRCRLTDLLVERASGNARD